MTDGLTTGEAPAGLIIVDKPGGWTSHDVVARGRRLTGTRKVGHAGTLDPMATGVLVLGVGRATRLLGHLALSSKGYDATVRLGQTTVTDDAEGQIVAAADAGHLTGAQLADAVGQLTGDLMQVPSAVSAVKISGQRAYARVRAGEAPQLAARPVRVDSFEVHDVRREGGFVDLDVSIECSSGTYVRALARDLGAELGVGGHLTSLRRTRVGGYTVKDAHTLDELDQELVVIPIDTAAATSFTTQVVTDAQVVAVRNGRALQVRLSEQPGPVALVTQAGEFLALYEQHGPVATAVAVFAPAPA